MAEYSRFLAVKQMGGRAAVYAQEMGRFRGMFEQYGSCGGAPRASPPTGFGRSSKLAGAIHLVPFRVRIARGHQIIIIHFTDRRGEPAPWVRRSLRGWWDDQAEGFLSGSLYGGRARRPSPTDCHDLVAPTFFDNKTDVLLKTSVVDYSVFSFWGFRMFIQRRMIS